MKQGMGLPADSIWQVMARFVMPRDNRGWHVWLLCKHRARYSDGLLGNLKKAQLLNHCVSRYHRQNNGKRYGVKNWAFSKEVKGQYCHNIIFQNSFPESCTLPKRDNVWPGKWCAEAELRFSEYGGIICSSFRKDGLKLKLYHIADSYI